jgi:dihydropteroate synthase
VIPRVIEHDLLTEMRATGCDRAGLEIMLPKAVHRVVKLTGIKPIAANIIKQEMLSFGGDAVTSYGTLDHSARATDVLLLGTERQLWQLIAKLKAHQFGLPRLAELIDRSLNNYEALPKPLRVGRSTWRFGRRTYVMGIMNVTPDSFSDGGQFTDLAAATDHARQLVKAGADIIDVGGESTRPGAGTVPIRTELARVVPVIKALVRLRIPVSIDTRKAAVAAAALQAGAVMVNDVSGLRYDRQMAKLIARKKVPICLMHMQGNPRTMQRRPSYTDVIGEIVDRLAESVANATNAGILHEKIILDPGLGFGKTVDHNLAILRRLREFKVLGCPLLIGPSRKSVIGQVLGLPVGERVEGTAAAVAVAIANGAALIRVHDVKEMVRVARMTESIMGGN